MVNYKGELLGIKGIGDKTVEDILTAFPDRKDLILAIMNEDDIPFRDDVVEKLKDYYNTIIEKDAVKISKGTVKLLTENVGLKMYRAHNPSFKIVLDGKSKVVKEEVAAYLLEHHADKVKRG